MKTSTTNKIHGETISSTIGVVTGWCGGTGGSIKNTMPAINRALHDLKEQASKLGADGIVGITLIPTSGDDVIVAMGTAVKFG